MAFGTVHRQIFPEGRLRDLSQIGNVVGDGEQLFIGQGTVALRKTEHPDVAPKTQRRLRGTALNWHKWTPASQVNN